MSESGDRIVPMEALAIFGFDGKIPAGLHVHPDRNHVIFALGNKLSILNVNDNKQSFLSGHTNTVSSIDVSKSGALVASGQINHMGFRAYVIVWDWETRSEKFRHELHKVRVETLCFTANELCLISLGGRDDGMLIVWDVVNNGPICGSKATSEVTGEANRSKCLQRRGSDFLTAGEQNLRLWCIDRENKKLTFDDVVVGRLRREFTSMCVNSIDEIMYAGTMSGDVAKIRLNCHHDPAVLKREKAPYLLGIYGRHNPKKPAGKDCEKYLNGVRALLILQNDEILIGAGDGTVELVVERNIKFNASNSCKGYPSPTWPQLKTVKKTKVIGAVSSLQQLNPTTILIGTDSSEIYSLSLHDFQIKLLLTCNTSTVYDIKFPRQFSMVFATASHQSVRIWSTTKKQELLRIMVPNFTAAAVVFSNDGKTIVTAWNDGVIRAFTPLTGKLIYAIPNAHNKGCSALAVSKCNTILVSGGVEGQVRVWKIEPTRQSLIGVLKEHTATIGTVDFNVFNNELVSASTDGTCIIWDLTRMSRKHVLYANTQFTCARYYPSGVQILATGTDRRISYWEVYDASLVRDVEASQKSPINCLDINSTGDHFVTAGSDQVVKIWEYQAGVPVATGIGHAAVIVSCAYSPCGKFVVTGSADGAVIIWSVPKKFWYKTPDDVKIPMSAKSSHSSIKTKSSKKVEHINQLETCRSNLDVHICECPLVDMKSKTDINEKCITVEAAKKK